MQQSLVKYSNHFPFGYLYETPPTPPAPPSQITSFFPLLHWKFWECNLTKSRFTQRIVQILRKNSSVEKDGCGWVGATYCVRGWSLWGPRGPAEDFGTMWQVLHRIRSPNHLPSFLPRSNCLNQILPLQDLQCFSRPSSSGGKLEDEKLLWCGHSSLSPTASCLLLKILLSQISSSCYCNTILCVNHRLNIHFKTGLQFASKELANVTIYLKLGGSSAQPICREKKSCSAFWCSFYF